MLAVLMKALGNLFLLTLIAPIITGSPVRIRSTYSVKESHRVPGKWSCIGRAPRNHEIRLQIGLKQGRFSDLERHLYEGELPYTSVHLIDLYSSSKTTTN